MELIIDPNTIARLNINMVMDCKACVICKKTIDVCDSNVNSEHTVCYVHNPILLLKRQLKENRLNESYPIILFEKS